MNLHRRPATHEDIPFLMRLRHQTMDAHVVASGGSPGEDQHRERLMYRFDCAEVLMDGEDAVGLLKVARGASEWKIIQIQIAPQLQGKGVGAALLREIIDEASGAGAETTLSVLKANPARRLYERLGFVIEGEDEFEYFMRRQR
jgi:ribosomal protein S18 acetylase RimI-like enzyme